MPATQSNTFWSDHLAEIDRREVTIAEYARQEGVSAASLYGWRNKLREQCSTTTSVHFAEVVTKMSVPHSSLLVRVGEATLEFDQPPDAAWLAQLLCAYSAR